MSISVNRVGENSCFSSEPRFRWLNRWAGVTGRVLVSIPATHQQRQVHPWISCQLIAGSRVSIWCLAHGYLGSGVVLTPAQPHGAWTMKPLPLSPGPYRVLWPAPVHWMFLLVLISINKEWVVWCWAPFYSTGSSNWCLKSVWASKRMAEENACSFSLLNVLVSRNLGLSAVMLFSR